jgi:predicted SprT family Zn-dependent metalloprotease
MNLHLARIQARTLMQQHGLADWMFRFDHARRRFGSCRYGRKIITLSKHLTFLNAEEQVRDTILHEIAHALTPGNGHGRKWKATCIRIGAQPTRCYSDHEVQSPSRPAARYQIGCQTCGWWQDRRRLTPSRYVCRRCRAKIVYRESNSGRLFVVLSEGGMLSLQLDGGSVSSAADG